MRRRPLAACLRALALCAAPAAAQLPAGVPLPADLPASMAVASVDALPTAPLLPALTPPAGAPRPGAPRARPHDRAQRGNDVLDGGPAPDRVFGGDGDVHGDSGGDRIAAGAGDDVVYGNNGTAVRSVDCGPGDDTIALNPYDAPGGVSNAQALRRHRIVGCGHVIEAPAVLDPSVGTKAMASSAGETLQGTGRNDNLMGGHGSDILLGLSRRPAPSPRKDRTLIYSRRIAHETQHTYAKRIPGGSDAASRLGGAIDRG